MIAKFNIIKRTMDMENPSRNKKEEETVSVSDGQSFEKVEDHYIFKIITIKPTSVTIEYDRLYSVKNEHRSYEYRTTLDINSPKEISSMWGKLQTTYKITYLGLEDEQQEQQEKPITINDY